MSRLGPLCLLLVLAGCSRTTNLTVEPRASAPTSAFVLVYPKGLEIQSVDFDATPDTEDGSPRAFVKAYAVDAETGTRYLLVYERLDKRSEPVAVIRFEPSPDLTTGR